MNKSYYAHAVDWKYPNFQGQNDYAWYFTMKFWPPNNVVVPRVLICLRKESHLSGSSGMTNCCLHMSYENNSNTAFSYKPRYDQPNRQRHPSKNTSRIGGWQSSFNKIIEHQEKVRYFQLVHYFCWRMASADNTWKIQLTNRRFIGRAASWYSMTVRSFMFCSDQIPKTRLDQTKPTNHWLTGFLLCQKQNSRCDVMCHHWSVSWLVKL